MMQIVLSPKASQTMDNYFENYIGSQNKNDMNQRAFHYSRILKCLSQMDSLESYVINGKNFVDIDDICRVEYRIENNNTEILIKDIYFNSNNDIYEEVKPVLDFMNRLLNPKCPLEHQANSKT